MPSSSPKLVTASKTFENSVKFHLEQKGISLKANYKVRVTLNRRHSGYHAFDLGNKDILVECKCYSWTKSGNNPSAKISTLRETLLYFQAAGKQYQKMIFVSKTPTLERGVEETLGQYFVRLNGHLIPDDVAVIEYDSQKQQAEVLF